MTRPETKIPHAGLKLSFALMLSLLVVPAYVVAPILFAELESVNAGLIAGKVFHLSNMVILILSLAAALFCYRIKVAKSTWYLLIAVVIMVAINTFGVTAMMVMIKAEAGDISALAEGDSMRLLFAFWHGMGSMLQLICSLLMAVLVMKGQKPAKQDEESV